MLRIALFIFLIGFTVKAEVGNVQISGIVQSFDEETVKFYHKGQGLTLKIPRSLVKGPLKTRREEQTLNLKSLNGVIFEKQKKRKPSRNISSEQSCNHSTN